MIVLSSELTFFEDDLLLRFMPINRFFNESSFLRANSEDTKKNSESTFFSPKIQRSNLESIVILHDMPNEGIERSIVWARHEELIRSIPYSSGKDYNGLVLRQDSDSGSLPYDMFQFRIRSVPIYTFTHYTVPYNSIITGVLSFSYGTGHNYVTYDIRTYEPASYTDMSYRGNINTDNMIMPLHLMFDDGDTQSYSLLRSLDIAKDLSLDNFRLDVMLDTSQRYDVFLEQKDETELMVIEENLSITEESIRPLVMPISQDDPVVRVDEIPRTKTEIYTHSKDLDLVKSRAKAKTYTETKSIPLINSTVHIEDKVVSLQDILKKRDEEKCSNTPELKNYCTVTPNINECATTPEMCSTVANLCSVGASLGGNGEESFCPVVPDLSESIDSKVSLDFCPVVPELKEKFFVSSDTQIKWYSLLSGATIDGSLVNEHKEYTIRVKEKDTDFDKPYYESRSATFLTQGNSVVAIVDKLLRDQGLVPTWEVDTKITKDAEVSASNIYLRDVMGVSDQVGSQEVDYLIKLHDNLLDEDRIVSLKDSIGLSDIDSNRYSIDLIIQARHSQNKNLKEFRENLEAGYNMPTLSKINYDHSIIRDEPLSGTGSIDEVLPSIGSEYDIVIASQGVYDRNSSNINGAYSVMRFKVDHNDANHKGIQRMHVKDKDGFDKIYSVKANSLSAIIYRKLQERCLKGVFVEIETHRDEAGRAYENGGRLNHSCIYLAGVQGAMTRFIGHEKNANPHQLGILIEEIKPKANHDTIYKRAA